MCLPAIVFFFLFSYVPMPGMYIAFTDFNYAKGIFGSDFIGFENFRFLFTSGQLSTLLRNTVLYNLCFIIVGNSVQIILAILLNEVGSKLFKKVVQSIMFLPYFISAVLVSLLVYNILNYDYGFLVNILRDLGMDPPSYYSTASVWPFIITLVYLWQSTGYGTVVYFAAITGIDASIMEAAKVDGANGWQRIMKITLPSLKPTIVILLLFALGGIIKGNFGLFYNIVGSNSVLYPTTDIIETYVYRATMTTGDFAQASAVGVFQSVVGFIIVISVNKFVRWLDEDLALF